MKIKIIFPVLICFLTFCLGIFSSCLNVQIKNAKPKVVIRGLVRKTINIKDKAFAYFEKLYTPKDSDGATIAQKEQSEGYGTGWFVYFYQSMSTVTSTSSNGATDEVLPIEEDVR